MFFLGVTYATLFLGVLKLRLSIHCCGWSDSIGFFFGCFWFGLILIRLQWLYLPPYRSRSKLVCRPLNRIRGNVGASKSQNTLVDAFLSFLDYLDRTKPSYARMDANVGCTTCMTLQLPIGLIMPLLKECLLYKFHVISCSTVLWLRWKAKPNESEMGSSRPLLYQDPTMIRLSQCAVSKAISNAYAFPLTSKMTNKRRADRRSCAATARMIRQERCHTAN